MKKKIALFTISVIILITMTLSGCSVNTQYIKVPKELEKLWEKDNSFDIANCKEIYVKSGNALKVLQLTDIHFDHNNNKKEQTLDLIKSVITQSKPDIIAVTGDWTSQQTNTLEHVKKVFDTIDSFGVPWAPVFGNHDAEGELSRVDYIPIFGSYKHCLFDYGYTNIGGLGNYIVNVRLDNSQGKLINSLVFMDSHTSTKYGAAKYLPMTKGQVDWYEWAIKGLNKEYYNQGSKGAIPSMAFFHIPAPEFETAFESGLISGENKEKPCPPYKNSGLIDKMIELKSTKGVFAGHDHDNNAAALYHGIVLAYGVESGWCQGYAEDSIKGGLLINIDEAGEFNLQKIEYDLKGRA